MQAGYSDVMPQQIEMVNGMYQFRYNLIAVAAVEDNPASWQYEYVEVSDLDRKVLIDALITSKYSYASQLGKLALARNSAEWSEYSVFRQACISAVDEALALL